LNIIVNPDDVDITLTGGLASRIAGVLIPYLKSTVIPDVITQVETTVTTLIDTNINADLYTYGVEVEVPELGGIMADYGQMATHAQVTAASTLEMAVNATFFN